MTAPAVKQAEPAVEVLKVLSVRVDRIRRMKGQPRRYFNPNKIRRLAQSMIKGGQKQPVIFRELTPAEKREDPDHDYELVDGERRMRSVIKAGKTRLTGIVIYCEDVEEYFEISAIANFCKEDHTHLEMAHTLRRIRRRRLRVYGKCTYKDLGDLFGQVSVWAVQHLSILKLSPQVRALMDPRLKRRDQLTFVNAYQISRIPDPAQQLRLAKESIANRTKLNMLRYQVQEILKGEAPHSGNGNGKYHTATKQAPPTRPQGRPTDRFRSMTTLAQNFKNNGNILRTIPRDELLFDLRSRPKNDQAKLQSSLDDCAALVEYLQAALRDAGKPLHS